MKKSFRSLKAEEVDVRPAGISDGKATLLLYQDARCAMSILDEYVGSENWQKEYYEAKGLLFCRIGIRNEGGDWIWKSDTGSGSNIEAEKGLASDAFKRAAVAWGIGRELYTAPKIIVPLNSYEMADNWVRQSFRVSEMVVQDGTIVKLVIVDKQGKERYRYSSDLPDRNRETFPDKIILTKKKTPEEKTAPEEKKPQLDGNEKLLTAFYDTLKERPDVDKEVVERFYNHFMSPSKEDRTVSIISQFKNLSPQRLWNWWLDNTSVVS